MARVNVGSWLRMGLKIFEGCAAWDLVGLLDYELVECCVVDGGPEGLDGEVDSENTRLSNLGRII